MRNLLIILLVIVSLLPYGNLRAGQENILAGRILLQVEEKGEAWYVNPANMLRYYLGRPDDAFKVMQDLGIGISNRDLEKIPLGLEYISGHDTDGDGLNDKLEEAIGTNPHQVDTDGDGHSDYAELMNGHNPLGAGRYLLDHEFARKHAGKIFLQTESRGEAWYVNPVNAKRYFLGYPQDAFNLMRRLGLGISNQDLGTISAHNKTFVAQAIEQQIQELVNQERVTKGLGELAWNPELAEVARGHSDSLAKDNLAFTGLGMSCDYPLIHHEGTDFGFYNTDRLNNRGFSYFSMAAENIALLSRASLRIKYYAHEPMQATMDECQATRVALDAEFKNALAQAADEAEKRRLLAAERTKRSQAFQDSFAMNVEETEWLSNDYLATESVKGWMGSPGHRENILNEAYDEAGVGAAFIDGYFIVTQVFIKRAECGFSGGACCAPVGYYPYCFTPLLCENNICSQ